VLSDGELWQRQRRLIHPSFSMREIKACPPSTAACGHLTLPFPVCFSGAAPVVPVALTLALVPGRRSDCAP